MAYIGQYIDRSPSVRAAGKIRPIHMTVQKNFKEPADPKELAETLLLHKRCDKICAFVPFKREQILKYDNDLFGRENEEYKFSEFRKNFLEQLMFKRAELGKAYNYKTKPEHINNETTTFGRKTYKPPDDMKALLKPADRMAVPKECIPSRQINRKYAPPYKADDTFGMTYKSDKRGNKVKNALVTCDVSTVMSKAQSEYLLRTGSLLGRRNLKHTYYFPVEQTPLPPIKSDECNLKALIENSKDCASERVNIVNAFSYLRKLRRDLENNRFVQLYDFLMTLKHNDKLKSGKMELTKVLKLANFKGIHLDQQYFEIILTKLALLRPDDKKQLVDYYKIVDLIDNHMPFVEPQFHRSVDEKPKCAKESETTYREFLSDMTKPVNLVTELGPCMIPKPDKIYLGDLIRSAAPIKYGLTTADLTKPRDKDQLRRIFTTVVGDRFDSMWSKANEKYNKGATSELLSVNQIRELLRGDNSL